MKITLVITALLDDTIKFAETLLIHIHNGETLSVPLCAQGYGSTICIDAPNHVIDFDQQFSNRECKRTFSLANKGRRSQKLTFSYDAPASRGNTKTAGNKVMRGNTEKGARFGSCMTIFNITPDRLLLHPGERVDLTVSGISDEAIAVTEEFICAGSFLDASVRVDPLFKLSVNVVFNTPLLEIQPPSCSFICHKISSLPFAIQSQTVTLTNVSTLTLTLLPTSELPFILFLAESTPTDDNSVPTKNDSTPLRIALAPLATVVLRLEYNPNFTPDRLSRVDSGYLVISYVEHPHVERIRITANVFFPNLVFSKNVVDFGCLLDNTSADDVVTIVNNSPLPVTYSWSFYSIIGDLMAQVVDVTPLKNTLQPKESENIRFFFFAAAGCNVEGSAICTVDMGPLYTLPIKGMASPCRYSLDRHTVDFGIVGYEEYVTKNLFLSNHSALPLPFAFLHPPPGTSGACVVADPTTGTAAPFTTQTIALIFHSETPRVAREQLMLQVAHFPPEVINVRGTGGYANIVLDLPRVDSSGYPRVLAAARVNLQTIDPSVPPGATQLAVEVDNVVVTEQLLLQPKTTVGSPSSTVPGGGRFVPRLLPYFLDLGSFIRGTVGTRQVTVTNPFCTPVSFFLDKRKLDPTKGFYVEPDKIVKLPPGERSTLTFSFSSLPTQRGRCALGPNDMTVFLEVVKGCRLPILVRATVCEPALNVLASSLLFGTVEVGYCRMLTFQLHNKESVPCSWFVDRRDKKLPVGLSKKAVAVELALREMVKCFEIVPLSGTLQPGARVNVSARFMPCTPGPFAYNIPILVEQGAFFFTLAASGEGFENRLELKTLQLELGPVSPNSAGGTESTIVVRNPSKTPIEFFSVDFDKQYVEEERVLRVTEGYDAKQRLFLPPRKAGDALPIELYIAAMARGVGLGRPASATATLAASRPVTPASTSATAVNFHPVQSLQAPGTPQNHTEITLADIEVSVPDLTVPPRPESPGKLPPAERAMNRYLGLDIQEQRRKIDKAGFNAVIHGPFAVGKSTIATLLARHFHGTVLTLDGVVEEAMNSETELGLRAKDVCVTAQTEQADESGTLPVPVRAVRGGSGGNLADGTETATSTVVPTYLPEDLLIAIVTARVKQDKETYGVIFDGVLSKYAPPTVAAAVMLAAIGARVHFVFITLTASRKVCAIRERQALKIEAARIQALRNAQLITLPTISEGEYDALPEEGKQAFEARVRAVKLQIKEQKRLAEEKERAEILRQQLEGEEAARVDAERGKQKKGGKGAGRESKLPPRPAKTPSVAEPAPKAKHASSILLTAPTPARAMSGSATRPMSSSLAIPAVGGGDSRQLLETALESLVPVNNPAYDEFETSYAGVLAVFDTWDRVNARPGGRDQEGDDTEASPAKSLFKIKDKETPKSHSFSKSKTSTGNRTPAQLKDEPSKPSTAKGGKADAQALDDAMTLADIAPPPAGKVADLVQLGVPKVTLDADQETAQVVSQVLDSAQVPSGALVRKALHLDEPPLALPDTMTYTIVKYPGERPHVPVLENLHFFDPTIRASQKESVETMPVPAFSRSKTSVPAAPPSTPVPKTAQGFSRQKTSVNAPPASKLTQRRVMKTDSDWDASKSGVHLDDVLSHPRWVVPAEGSVTLHLRYRPTTCAIEERVLRFETTTGRQSLQVLARATCEFPHFNTDPAIMFPKVMRSRESAKIRQQTFVRAVNVFEFGAIICGKPREEFKNETRSANMVKINIVNPSAAEITVQSTLSTDSTTFFIEPSILVIPPGATQHVCVWAFPKNAIVYEDVLTLSTLNNPEVFKCGIMVEGVSPLIEFDRRSLHFDRVLLLRKETRTLVIRNKNKLAVAWTILGADLLGDEFQFSATKGIIAPQSEGSFDLYFKAAKAMAIKKAIKVEVVAIDTPVPIVIHSEAFVITVEAYDVALDITFPKSADGFLDFEIAKIGEDKILSCLLKNKGKYELGYAFILDERLAGKGITPDSFQITPHQGTLAGGEKPVNVKFMFRPTKEFAFSQLTALKVVLLDPSLPVPIAEIPVKMSVRSVYSKYSVTPARCNFGPVTLGPKYTREICIENTGETDFRFYVGQSINQQKSVVGKMASKSQKGGPRLSMVSPNTPASTSGYNGFNGNQKLSVGCFTLTPGVGSVAPGASVRITIEADPQG